MANAKNRLAIAPHMRHLRRMSMLAITPTAARGNLSKLPRRALKSEDIGIIVDAKTIAPRPVTVQFLGPRGAGILPATMDSPGFLENRHAC